MIVIIVHILPRDVDCLAKPRLKLEFMNAIGSSKGGICLTDSWGQPKDKGVAPLVLLSIGLTHCGHGFHEGTSGDPTMTPSEKNK